VSRRDELRQIAKIAGLYYQRGMRQADIAAQMSLSQSTVSRLLKRAEQEHVVRITVSPPPGAHTDLESELEARYGLKEAVVVDTAGDDEQILRDLGSAAAFYVETTLKEGDVVGISSWSATLLAMVDALHPLPKSARAEVVQILGGVGNPAAEVHAAHLTRRLATVTHGSGVFLPAPGVAGSAEAARIYLDDPFVRAAADRFAHVTLALVGIGALEPSRLLASSGNIFSKEELDLLRARGAVGDICLRFFDQQGQRVLTPLDERVIGIRPEQLRGVARSVGIAGGQRKHDAIRGALASGWINVLITDLGTAEALTTRPPNGRATSEPNAPGSPAPLE
jgi:DNA-binding transcriptional regulator LsrR (DeoR family)